MSDHVTALLARWQSIVSACDARRTPAFANTTTHATRAGVAVTRNAVGGTVLGKGGGTVVVE